MKFKYIETKNFRQFSNVNRIDFSTDETRNLTIIHSLNGGGKTTLLQAFNWCLYNHFSLPNKDEMLNNIMYMNMAEGDVEEIYVELGVLHADTEYTIRRSVEVEKQSNKKSKQKNKKFVINYIDSDANSKHADAEAASNLINQLLPEKLSTYFLFDGERMKNLGENNAVARKDISEGIKNILNIDVYDALRVMLNGKVLKLLNSQLKSDETNKLIQAQSRYAELQEKIDEKTLQMNRNEKRINELIDEINELSHKISENGDALLYEKQLSEYKEKHADISETLKAIFYPGKKNHRSFPTVYTEYTLVRLLNTLKSDLFLNLNLSEQSRDENQISGINSDAIDEVLERKICICGRKVTKNEWDILSNLKQYLPPHDHRILVNSYRAKSEERLSKYEDIINNEQELIKEVFKLQNEQRDYEEKIKYLNTKINNIDAVKKLHVEREQKETEKNNLIFNQGSLQEEIKKYRSESEQEQVKIAKYADDSDTNKLITKCIKYTESLIKILDDNIRIKKQSIHEDLQKEVNEIFSKVAHKKTKEVIIDLDYRYKIRDKVTGSEALSEGESIVTSLSLIAAILKIVKRQVTDKMAKKNELDEAIEYPLVLDAPFAKLDNTHITGIAPLLPEFADQVILFSIDMQFKGAVEERVKKYIGKQYDMVNNGEVNVTLTEII